ncbi:MAG TPA: SDR family NAD(P)-dependent oxidoreductase [Bryobacteraceae bacterium]|nr:SDR family NAD(P)-dependent oxidoreductase [Bryobacteraceae bacterium]
MAAQTFVITGSNSGLGFHCARFIGADPNNTVVIACRDPGKGQEAQRALQHLGSQSSFMPLDLASLESVRAFVDLFKQAGLPQLAGVICNAGLQNIGEPTKTRDGYEATFGVNHLGHFLLSNLLLPRMAAGGKFIFVSSGTHDPNEKAPLPEPRYENAEKVAADFEPGRDAGRRRYTTSKLCNVYCTYEFARRLESSSDPRLRSLRVLAFDPGLMPGTGLARTYPPAMQFAWNYVLPVATLFMRNAHMPAKSGKRLADLATDLENPATAKYYSDGKEKKSSDLSYDLANAKELWDTSARMVGISPAIP